MISKIIAEHGLEIGVPMKNMYGEDIENSIVIDARTWGHFDTRLGPAASFVIEEESPFHNTTSKVSLGAESFAAIIRFLGDAA